MTTNDELEKAAREYCKFEDDYNIFAAFISGAKFERERILKMLREDKGYWETTLDIVADWLEEKLK